MQFTPSLYETGFKLTNNVTLILHFVVVVTISSVDNNRSLFLDSSTFETSKFSQFTIHGYAINN